MQFAGYPPVVLLYLELPTWIEQWRSRAGSPAQRWGLALGADLAVMNRSRYDCLHTGHSVIKERGALAAWWRVRSADDLRFQLDSLFGNGYGGPFAEILRAVEANDPLEGVDDPAVLARAAFLRQHLRLAQDAGHIEAFDLGRVAPLARFGYSARYIGADEAWQWVDRAARAAQPLFTSWTEYASNYWLGLDFWTAGEPTCSPQYSHRLKLLNDPSSPWVQLPWATPLGP